MVGENGPKLGNSGEKRGDQERAEMERRLGRELIHNAFESNDFSNLSIDDMRRIFPIRRGENDAQHVTRMELYRSGKLPVPRVIEIEGGNYQEIPQGKYGDDISEESIANLMNLSPEKRKSEIEKWDENYRKALEQSKDEGYQKAQQELAEILGGKAPAERLEEMKPNLAILQAQVAEVKKNMYTDPELKAWQERQIAEVESELAEYQRKVDMVANLVPGETGRVVPLTPETEPTGNVDTRATMLETNTPPSRTQEAYLNGLKDVLTSEEYENILNRIKQMREKASGQGPEEDFAENENTAPTEEEIAAAAAAAEPETWRVKNFHETNKDNHEAQQKAYREARTQLAREAENLEPGRFDDKEAMAAEERAELLRKAKESVAPRGFFKRLRMKAILGLATAASLLPFVTSTAQAANIPVQPRVVETEDNADEDVEDEGNQAISQALKVAMDGAIVAKNTLNNKGAIDSKNMTFEKAGSLAEADEAWRNEKWSLGEEYYEGFMEDENSQMMENGLRSNFSDYQSPNKHSKNSYGESIEDTYGDEVKFQHKFFDMVKAQPQAMASVMATFPKLMQQCGVSDEITSIKNVEDRATAVMDLLLEEKGGEWQNIFMGAIVEAFSADTTEYNFYEEYGKERTFYMKQDDPSQPDRPDNIVLKTDIKQRHGEKQVQITIIYPDGTVEIGDFNLACGGQTNLDVITYEVRTQITKKADLVIVEDEDKGIINATVITTPETPETPPEGDPDPTPEDDTPPPEETVTPKDEEKEKEVVDDGGQTNPVDETEQDQPVTEEPVNDNADEIANAEPGDDQAENAAIEADKSAEDISDDDFFDYVEKHVEQSNNDTQSSESQSRANENATTTTSTLSDDAGATS